MYSCWNCRTLTLIVSQEFMGWVMHLQQSISFPPASFRCFESNSKTNPKHPQSLLSFGDLDFWALSPDNLSRKAATKEWISKKWQKSNLRKQTAQRERHNQQLLKGSWCHCMISEMNLLICRNFFPLIVKFWYQNSNIIHMKSCMISVKSEHDWFMWRGIAAQKRTEPNSSKRSKKDSVLLCLQINSQVKTWKLSLRPLKDWVHSTEGPQVDNGGVHVSHSYYSWFFTKRTTSWIPVPPDPTAGLRQHCSSPPAAGTRLLHPCRLPQAFS